MTAEELGQIENDFEHRVGAVTVGDMRRLIAEVRRLHGIQKVLADCREESSAWADGYRTAVKDAEQIVAREQGLTTAGRRILNLLGNSMLDSLALLTPESSLAKQRQKETAQ